MESKKKYKVGEDTYNIDDNDSKLFLKDFPNAIEVFSYVADGDTYNLDASDIKPFLKDFPDAKPTLKKKKKFRDYLRDYFRRFSSSIRVFRREY